MKITEKINIAIMLDSLGYIMANESATADKIGKAIADLERSKKASTSKNLEHILRNVIDTLRKVKEKIPRELRNQLSQEVVKLNAVMKTLGFDVPSSFSKLNPKT
jgi:signal transduction histidine kinase